MQDKKIQKPLICGADSISEAVAVMSEGNPGAAAVLTQLVQYKGNGLFFLLALDDMQIRGEAIWRAYANDCSKNVKLLMREIAARGLSREGSRDQNSRNQSYERSSPVTDWESLVWW
jgi:hypothetical protein